MTSKSTQDYWIRVARGWSQKLSPPQYDQFNQALDELVATRDQATSKLPEKSSCQETIERLRRLETDLQTLQDLRAALRRVLYRIDYVQGVSGPLDDLTRDILSRAREILEKTSSLGG